MADWAHCNVCFALPKDGRKFSLSSCFHLFCEKCVQIGTKSTKCPVCGTVCGLMSLTSKMSDSVQLFFLEPQALIRKSLKQALQVLDFQKGHRDRMIKYKHDLEMNFRKRDQKNMEHIGKLEKENMKLKEQILYLKKLMSTSGFSGRSSPKSGNQSPSHLYLQRLLAGSPNPPRSQASGAGDGPMFPSNQKAQVYQSPQMRRHLDQNHKDGSPMKVRSSPGPDREVSSSQPASTNNFLLQYPSTPAVLAYNLPDKPTPRYAPLYGNQTSKSPFDTSSYSYIKINQASVQSLSDLKSK